MGRGGATTFAMDMQHADAVMIMGSNMAECHPIAFRWVMKAKANGAKVIHIDPRFTRTSAMAEHLLAGARRERYRLPRGAGELYPRQPALEQRAVLPRATWSVTPMRRP